MRNARYFTLEWIQVFLLLKEGNPLEPPHIHVFKAGSEAKFWLTPEVQLASNDGFDAKQLRIITQMIIEHCSLLEASWHDYFS
ncbi:DUF4160 domain-containing protein [Vreelandella azerica]|uniref:DUF4160 domain-containing protein n=1 Tax=Vreelandella azerica TaxID=2732867 RepID=UPI001F27AA07|nr:DUF4160 domain-containing protein [Halomonas azerica]